ncbi:nucleotidyltransferase family protein [Aromatoleum petrolei]|uniref:NTP transferase domain-containing protein n=1 Tax=Aromatoleum petrolei TaxID=76116 RepID=A0ABX1MVR0_9RHOO|nr:nucleotidyltransferase family protein [Aromatoleum petrolei]NMF90673.1 NTP transferase domain-containing protein [Aromatoleum petrolei]QTQ38779.1 NTP transferase domain-containing protein [Aromatoleum petrolei]
MEDRPKSPPGIVGILLAAGQGSRFGSNKLCHPLPDGTPVAVRSATNLRGALGAVLAVVRPEDSLLRGHFDAAGLPYVLCPDAEQGMAATLACGIRATACTAGWVIALGDMPYIRPETIAAVAAAIGGGALLAAPFVDGERGHPVGFAVSLKDELLALQGDEGARRVIVAHKEQLRRVHCDDPGVLADIDVPGDVRA